MSIPQIDFSKKEFRFRRALFCRPLPGNLGWATTLKSETGCACSWGNCGLRDVAIRAGPRTVSRGDPVGTETELAEAMTLVRARWFLPPMMTISGTLPNRRATYRTITPQLVRISRSALIARF